MSLNFRKMNDTQQIIHYQSNVAALQQLGSWFDYMRANGVYDNTRIILVADHGRILRQLDDLIVSFDDGTSIDISAFYPLLMVKDFNAKDFKTSDEFMTNADVPTIAFDSIVNDPVNPFTGAKIDSAEKNAHDQYITNSQEFSVGANSGNIFSPADWYAVHDDIRDPSNWKQMAVDSRMPY